MNLERIERLVEVMNSSADTTALVTQFMQHMALTRTLLPKLLAVAKSAKIVAHAAQEQIMDDGYGWTDEEIKALDELLNSLETLE